MLHPLKCQNCLQYRYLEITPVIFEKNNKAVIYNIPFLNCKNCNTPTPLLGSRDYYEKEAEEDRKRLKDGEEVRLLFHYENQHFNRFDHLGFIYDSIDYYLIPGLRREFDEGYLAPVFFDKDLLLYYNNHPDYSVKLDSFSSGNIYYKNKRMFNWGFGINRYGKIFKWLGDLNEDFKGKDMSSHLKRFQASNIESDHDIVSKFYLSQNPFSPSDAFQDSDNERKFFGLKNSFENEIQKKYGFLLSKIDIAHLIDYYKHPILDDREQIFSAYLSLNKLIIENIQQDELKRILKQSGITKNELKGLRSLKLLGLFYEKILSIENPNKLLSPLYVLYDLRQLHGHLIEGSFEEKYNFCKKRLNLNQNATHFEVYTTMVKELIDYFNFLNEKVETHKSLFSEDVNLSTKKIGWHELENKIENLISEDSSSKDYTHEKKLEPFVKLKIFEKDKFLFLEELDDHKIALHLNELQENFGYILTCGDNKVGLRIQNGLILLRWGHLGRPLNKFVIYAINNLIYQNK